LYFSYGSNMAEERIRERVKSATLFSSGIIEQHTLRFHKSSKDGSAKCDAFFTGEAKDSLPGVLFVIDAAEKEKLDRAEGKGLGYEVKTVSVVLPTGERKSAFTYYATNIDEHLKPYTWYVNHVLKGAETAELPVAHIDFIRSVEAIRDPDIYREKKQLSVYHSG